ncbi:MAG: hypothetical protein ABJB86_22385 [Bacteroidota bacterium]
MMKRLRKRHLQIWMFLAFLLPAGILVGWLTVPKEPVQAVLQPETSTPLPVVLKRSDKQNYTAAIRSSTDGLRLQLEWINKIALQYPAATIYAGTTSKDLNKAKLIGRIEARGNWYLPLDSTFKATSGNTDHFILYDFIHHQVIDTINFKP